MTPEQLTLLPPARPLRERFGAEFFRQVPERPGVYLLCGPRDGVLYVGKAKNLRRRLGSYRSANPDRVPRKLRRLLAAVERILWDECPSEEAALARERELLQTLRPRFNTVGVRPLSPAWLGWRPGPRGLELGRGAMAEVWADRHGPFAQSRALFGALLRLLWWRLNPKDPAENGHWMALPPPLAAERSPARWVFAMSLLQAQLAAERLRAFFRDGSLDLIEWCLAATADLPRFERAWLERDAIVLLQVHERLTAGTDGASVVH
ncbi:MAG: GIY-YIG nuclease family protein [Verrucomicrobia bacterium]|nr:GIY-YIG nuclease family protein [Verrucomicrobiota bacterium]